MRVVFLIFYLKNPGTGKQLITYDIVVSLMLFIVTFLPFIESIAKSIERIF
jgi:hypothetical protein